MRLKLSLPIALALACTVAFAAPPKKALQPAAAVEWGPVLGHATTVAVDVAWRTTTLVRSGVVCNGQAFGGKTASNVHRTTVSGLKPGKAYTYRLFWYENRTRRLGPPLTLKTVPMGAKRFDFVAFGDTRSNPGDHQQVVDQLLTTKPAFALNSGDLVADGTSMAAWREFFRIEGRLLRSMPYYCVLGNHERNSDMYYSSFALPSGGGERGKEWYAFAYGNCYFVALDTNRQLDEQAAWLQQKLNSPAARRATWRIALLHAPPFSSGTHGGDKNVLGKWVPVFEKCGVNVVFCGHDHIYERSVKSGITYIVTGGGGAPRYPIDTSKNPYSQKAVSTLHFCRVHVDGATLKIQAIKPDGTIFDVVQLYKKVK